MIRSIQNFFYLFPLYCISFRDAIYFIGRWLITPLSFIERLLPKEGTVIDIGCGEGMLANLAAMRSPKRRIIGFDLNAKRVAVAEAIAKNRIANIKFFVSDALAYNFSDVAAITLVDVLHHIPARRKQEDIIRIISNQSHSDTVLIIREACFDGLLKWRFANLADKLLYRGDTFTYRSVKEWKELLQRSNFSVNVYKTNPFSPISSYLFVAKKN